MNSESYMAGIAINEEVTQEQLDSKLQEISHTEHELACLDKQYRAMIAGPKHRLEELKREFEPMAEAYMRQSNEADPKKKTLTLWHGTLRLRKVAARLEVDDVEAAVRRLYAPHDSAWTYDEEDFLQPRQLDKSKYLEIAREFIDAGIGTLPGIKVHPERTSFSYSTPTPKISDILEDTAE